MKLERIVNISPAFDERHDDPRRDYGIASCNIWFILKGPKGAVQVMFNTDWYLPETIKEYREKGNENLKPPIELRNDNKFLKCFDVGFHSLKPQFDGHKASNCDILPKGKCYYDGSALRGEELKLADVLIRQGSEAIWKFLEEEYKREFDNNGKD